MKKILMLSIMVIFILPITSKSNNNNDGLGFDYHWSFYWPNGKIRMPARYSCITFLDSLNGLIGANFWNSILNPSILRTTDGGKSWKEIFYDKSTYKYDSVLKKSVAIHRAAQIRDIAYVDTNLIVAVCSNQTYIYNKDTVHGGKPYMITSTDKGKNWSFVYLPEDQLFTRIAFDYKKQGFIFDEEGYIFTTIDTGNTWTKISYPPDSVIYGLYDSLRLGLWDMKMFNDSTMLLFTLSYDSLHRGEFYINKTTNKGKTWDINQCQDSILGQMKLCFVDENEGWFGGYGPVNNSGFRPILIYHTTNAGKSWEKQLDTVNNRITQAFWKINLKFYDKLNGIFATFKSDVYLTTDGGKNWVLQAKNIHDKDGYLNPTDFIDVCFVNKNLILGVTERGMIARYDRNKIEGVEDEPLLWNNTQNLIIYPNPIKDNKVNFKIDLKNNSDLKVDLINSLGIIVGKSFTDYLISGSHSIQYTPDANLPSGTYWLRMTINNKEMIVKPVVVLK